MIIGQKTEYPHVAKYQWRRRKTIHKNYHNGAAAHQKRGEQVSPFPSKSAEIMAEILAEVPLQQALEGLAVAKNVPASLKVSEVLTSILEATSQTTERATLQLTIPPGGELRIDSDLFIVLLNGENALHTQSGDWINISRNLLRLIVESASGGLLQGQLIYTERYL